LVLHLEGALLRCAGFRQNLVLHLEGALLRCAVAQGLD